MLPISLRTDRRSIPFRSGSIIAIFRCKPVLSPQPVPYHHKTFKPFFFSPQNKIRRKHDRREEVDKLRNSHNSPATPFRPDQIDFKA